MTEEPFTRLMGLAARDAALQAELRGAADRSAVIRIGELHGITLTEADLPRAGELDDAELETASGGTLQLTYNPWTCHD